MNPSEVADLRCDLLAFTKAMFKARSDNPFRENLHQELICNALERVFIGKSTRLVINVPPRSGKTELAERRIRQKYRPITIRGTAIAQKQNRH